MARLDNLSKTDLVRAIAAFVAGMAILFAIIADAAVYFHWSSGLMSTDRLTRVLMAQSKSIPPDIDVIQNAARRLRERREKSAGAAKALESALGLECCEVIQSLTARV